MIKKVRIAVDHGNRNMKTCSQVFTTGLTIQDKKPARGEKFLFYEGKYYVLSENRIPYQRDKTQDDRFFILTLFAIVKELEENPQIQPGDVIQVDLPIGLPPKHYAELCERYEAYFKRQGKLVKWMSYEQAIQVAITGKGKFSGKTMGQVAMESPSSLQWFAEQY